MVNQASISSAKKAVNMQMREDGSNIVWLGVQGKKILISSGIMLKGNDGVKISIRKKIVDKRNASVFPSWRVRAYIYT